MGVQESLKLKLSFNVNKCIHACIELAPCFSPSTRRSDKSLQMTSQTSFVQSCKSFGFALLERMIIKISDHQKISKITRTSTQCQQLLVHNI